MKLKKIFEYLNQPYPQIKNKWKLILSSSIFISLFIAVYQPFGLSHLKTEFKTFYLLGFGAVTFFALALYYTVFQGVFKIGINEKKWNLRKHIFWVLGLVFVIGLCNYLYTAFLFSYWKFNLFIEFQVYTILLSFFPITIVSIILQNIKFVKNDKTATELNENIHSKISNSQIQTTIRLTSENEKEKFETELKNLSYIESTGNYIEIFYFENDKLKNKLLRSSLKRVEMELISTAIVRCHRAFMVNVDCIVNVKGNAQGLQLRMIGTEMEIPVSRNYVKSLKERIS